MDTSLRITRRQGDVEEIIEIGGASAKLPAIQPVLVVGGQTAQGSDGSKTPELEWSPTLCDGKRVTYADAEKACAALGEGWRLPTRPELESILDLSRHEPACDPERFPDMKSSWYWSSTPCAWSSDRAWCVDFDYGYAYGYHRDDLGAFARAVRAVPAGQ